MSEPGQQLLFVYGSLRTCESHVMGRRLLDEARLLEPATLAGQLYAISWYPGAVDGVAQVDLVQGEVFALATPDATLAWLDEYEGLVPAASSVAPPAEYARVERTVRLASGRAATAWVYLYQRALTGKLRIFSGDWSDRARILT